MDAPPTTKTQIAKWVVQSAVAASVAGTVQSQLEDRTEMDPDGKPIEIISGAVGYLVASRLRSQTDKAVDYTIDRYKSWREKRKQETPSEVQE